MKWFITASIVALGLLASNANANNVAVSIRGGSLYVYGDDGANDIKIMSTQAGSITVSGVVTTVNDGNTPVTLNGWTSGIFVYLSNGDDSAWLQSGNVLGATHFDLGNGNDEVLIGDGASLPAEYLTDELLALFPDSMEALSGANLRLNQSLTVLGFAGQDSVYVANCTVVGFATFDMGNSADDVYLGTDSGVTATFFENSVVVVPGTGADSTSVSQVRIKNDLIVDDPTNASIVDVFGSRIGGNLMIFTSLGVDYVNVESVTVIGLLKTILKDANDKLILSDVVANRIEFFLGIGNDQVVATDVETPNLLVFLEDGTDKSTIQQSAITNSYYYGAGGDDYFTIQSSTGANAYIYGDSGTDTFKQSGNSIDKVYTYSIERKL